MSLFPGIKGMAETSCRSASWLWHLGNLCPVCTVTALCGEQTKQNKTFQLVHQWFKGERCFLRWMGNWVGSKAGKDAYSQITGQGNGYLVQRMSPKLRTSLFFFHFNTFKLVDNWLLTPLRRSFLIGTILCPSAHKLSQVTMATLSRVHRVLLGDGQCSIREPADLRQPPVGVVQ